MRHKIRRPSRADRGREERLVEPTNEELVELRAEREVDFAAEEEEEDEEEEAKEEEEGGPFESRVSTIDAKAVGAVTFPAAKVASLAMAEVKGSLPTSEDAQGDEEAEEADGVAINLEVIPSIPAPLSPSSVSASPAACAGDGRGIHFRAAAVAALRGGPKVAGFANRNEWLLFTSSLLSASAAFPCSAAKRS